MHLRLPGPREMLKTENKPKLYNISETPKVPEEC